MIPPAQPIETMVSPLTILRLYLPILELIPKLLDIILNDPDHLLVLFGILNGRLLDPGPVLQIQVLATIRVKEVVSCPRHCRSAYFGRPLHVHFKILN